MSDVVSVDFDHQPIPANNVEVLRGRIIDLPPGVSYVGDGVVLTVLNDKVDGERRPQLKVQPCKPYCPAFTLSAQSRLFVAGHTYEYVGIQRNVLGRLEHISYRIDPDIQFPSRPLVRSAPAYRTFGRPFLSIHPERWADMDAKRRLYSKRLRAGFIVAALLGLFLLEAAV